MNTSDLQNFINEINIRFIIAGGLIANVFLLLLIYEKMTSRQKKK